MPRGAVRQWGCCKRVLATRTGRGGAGEREGEERARGGVAVRMRREQQRCAEKRLAQLPKPSEEAFAKAKGAVELTVAAAA